MHLVNNKYLYLEYVECVEKMVSLITGHNIISRTDYASTHPVLEQKKYWKVDFTKN